MMMTEGKMRGKDEMANDINPTEIMQWTYNTNSLLQKRQKC